MRLLNIWVYGDIEELYKYPHDLYPNGWELLDDDDLGVLYLKEYDVYPYNFSAHRHIGTGDAMQLAYLTSVTPM